MLCKSQQKSSSWRKKRSELLAWYPGARGQRSAHNRRRHRRPSDSDLFFCLSSPDSLCCAPAVSLSLDLTIPVSLSRLHHGSITFVRSLLVQCLLMTSFYCLASQFMEDMQKKSNCAFLYGLCSALYLIISIPMQSRNPNLKG